MQEDIPYKPHPTVKKQLDEHMKGYNKDEFYNEISAISQTNLSTEMKLVLEFFLRFQWTEEEAKDLLWYLYASTSEERANTYLTSKKIDDIKKMYTSTVAKELGYFRVRSEGTNDEIQAAAGELAALNTLRNGIVHHLYSQKIREKQPLINELTTALARTQTLDENIQLLQRRYELIAGGLEARRKLSKE